MQFPIIFWVGLLHPADAQRGPFRFAAPPVFVASLTAGAGVDVVGAATTDALADDSDDEAVGLVVDVVGSAATSSLPPRTGIQRSNVLAGGM